MSESTDVFGYDDTTKNGTESAWHTLSNNVRRYSAWWPLPDGAIGEQADEARKKRIENNGQVASDYYDIVSPSYEKGWGQNFHYAPMTPQKSIKQSIEEYEVLLGQLTGLKAGMKVLDVGCGLGGPARNVATKFGCKVVGITNSDWHVKRGSVLNQEAGLNDQVEIVKGDFHHLPFEDNTFDAAYAFEAICYAPNLTIVYNELRRVLKPGAYFGLHEWVMTSKFDSSVDQHRVIRDQIERGNGLVKMPLLSDVRSGLDMCGFEITHDENMESRSKPGPWFYPLLGMLRYATCKEDFRTAVLMERRIVVPIVDLLYRFRVKLGVVPPEFLTGFDVMKACTISVARGSQEGIFTPMWVFIAKNKK